MRISLIGRIGQDAVVNNVNGKNVINFSVAYSDKFKNNQGEDVERTTWVSCAYWSEKLNISNYLKKGTLIYVEGKPESKIYVNKIKNETTAQLYCRVSSVQLLSSSKQSDDLNVDQTPF